MAHHKLSPSPETVHWGWFDYGLPPVLTVESGDRVTVETVSGGPDNLPGDGYHIPPELFKIHEVSPRRLPGHILTGPIAVKGAVPGDVLEVKILDIRLRQDWGYTFLRPLSGALPGEFEETEQMIVRLDREKNTGLLPWGTELPLRPFFGVMGVAPPAAWGSISSIQPRAHGGNLDNKEMIPGTSLYLPVLRDGAHLSMGDGHGVQGDGEVCTTAIETALEGEVELILHKGLGWTYPRAETSTHWITMGMDVDLDDAAKHALRQMIEWIVTLSNLTHAQAYMLMSLAADVRITQLVNQEKGSHVMLPKMALGRS
jgi:acetamidase/formamidase